MTYLEQQRQEKIKLEPRPIEKKSKYPYYEEHNKGVWWCNTHQRKATHQIFGDGWTSICCAPNQSGITFPCVCVCLNGIAELIEV